MYVKIQKDNSENYILLEAENAELSYIKINTTFKRFCLDFLVCLLNKETSEKAKFMADTLMAIFKDILINAIPATCMSVRDCKYYWEGQFATDFPCSIKGIKIDGVPYVTCGNIYIMNDKGQTIQKI